MKKIKTLSLIICLVFSSNCMAFNYSDENISALDVIVDGAIMRPAGLVSIVVGSAMFVVSSPFVAIASMAQPGDGFRRVKKAFIDKPVKFTFYRRVGDYRVFRKR